MIASRITPPMSDPIRILFDLRDPFGFFVVLACTVLTVCLFLCDVVDEKYGVI